MAFIELIEAQRHPSPLPTSGKMRDVLLTVNRAGERGMTTRDIADACDLSVYSARNWLMKLENEGRIYKTCRPRNTTWHHY